MKKAHFCLIANESPLNKTKFNSMIAQFSLQKSMASLCKNLACLICLMASVLVTFGAESSPAQAGSPKPGRNGPFLYNPNAPIPKHAYSPFAGNAQEQAERQPTEKDYAKDRIVFKLAPLDSPRLKARYSAVTEEKLLADTLTRHGLKDNRRVFENIPEAHRKALVSEGKPDITRWHRAVIPSGQTVADVLQAMADDPSVEYAEPDYVRHMAVLPDSSTDPKLGDQWHLAAIHAPEAWTFLQSQGLPPGGSPDVVVAVIDTGIDTNHEDLAANLWTGQHGEHGFNAITGSNNPMDDNGHGTHVAGIIAATGLNHVGGVGVAYGVKIMAIKAAQYSGVLSVSDIAAGIYYAVANGADVINMSFGGYFKSQVEEDALTVAFGQCVLVAAAGNDTKNNDPACLGTPMYPAAYNWVLGVMASTPSGSLAAFSNFDCIPHNSYEYELMAPGVDIWSTLPNNQYAAWDGTSMAAPIVSGIAALVRTKFPDKDTYSSRFIMGQIAANAGSGANALAALTVAPKPELSFQEFWLFDTGLQATNNDNDGRVDAGETIDLAIVIRNHWGKASNVVVTLDAWADGAFQPDPYITWLTNVVDYGAIGAFNWDDNGLIYSNQVITGVRYPFRFQVASNCPNDHVIPFRLNMTCRNGFDPADTTDYTFQSRFSLVVQRGRELPRIISQDMTLTKDDYWIAPAQTLIERGVTVTVKEGTQIQFFSSDPTSPYNPGAQGPYDAYIRSDGNLLIQGTAAEPVEIFNTDLHPIYPVTISGNGQMSYVRIQNPWLSLNSNYTNTIDHAYFLQSSPGGIDGRSATVSAYSITKSVFYKLGVTMGVTFSPQNNQHCNLYDSCRIACSLNNNSNNVFLRNFRVGDSLSSFYFAGYINVDSGFRNNAILNWLWNPNIYMWLRVYPSGNPSHAESNFWGTTSLSLIDLIIKDYNDDFNMGRLLYEPILETAPEAAYPFVSGVMLSAGTRTNVTVAGAEPLTLIVTFNRNMNTNIQPLVSFGPDVPYTDFTVHKVAGGWQDAQCWIGTFNITPITGDGYQLIRVAGAVAASDPWLVTGDDGGRFRFEIITSGTESMNLQATGGEGKVDLSWMQDDFELLAGYNLYRSTNSTNGFARINTSIVPAQQKAYRDTQVQPGRPYYYKFTVVKTDMSESDFSNLASAAPIDTIPPVISHTPVTSAQPGLPLTIFADVTDNVSVQGVTLYFRAINTTNYSSRAMTHTTLNRYAATIEGSRLVSPGIEYYIEATDGITVVRSGRPEAAYPVVVNDQPVITAITPTLGTASGGTAVTLGGANFQTGATVSFGGLAATNVVVVSSSQINCVTSPHFPATVDVTVSNSNNGSGTVLNGYTFQSDVVSLSLPATGGAQHSIVSVPINAANMNGAAAASLTVTFDPAVVQASAALLGSLTPGWIIAVNTNTVGQIRISMASPGPTSSGAGVLAYLNFVVVGAPDSTTALTVASISINDGAVQVQAANGSFTVNRVFNVGGTVTYWNGSVAVPGVTATLLGNTTYSGTSGTNGVFAVAGAAGDYTLSLSKSDDTNGISAYDASLVLQHDAGLITLTGPAAIAADVNKSGQITSFDAYYILQKAVDAITLPFPGAGKVWVFEPNSRTVTGLTNNLNGQNFTAILLGDVSGNWAPGQLVGIQSYAPVTVALKKLVTTHPAGTNIWFVLKSPSAAVYGIDLTLAYDSGTTRVRNTQTGPLGEAFAVAWNTNESGVIKVALASAVPLQGIGGMMIFDVSGSPAATLQISNVSINEGLVDVQIDSTGATFDLDSDGDGQSDWQEIQAGTDPMNPNQFLKAMNVNVNGDGSRIINVSSVPGKTYQLQFKNALPDASWQNVGGPVTATSAITPLPDADIQNNARFYRVQLVE